MAKEIDKIIQSKTAPKNNNVLWDDGESLKINRNGKWESAGGGAPMINITYANLVELRNNSKLIAGMQYRITDYVTTTVQINTQSAGHQFDVIVLALSENTLAEEAYAIQSARDTDGYFANSNLAAWQIWYSLDNDPERFAWAEVVKLEEHITSAGETKINFTVSGVNYNGAYYKLSINEELYLSYGPSIKVTLTSDNILVVSDNEGYISDGNPIIAVGFQEGNGRGVIYRMIDEWNNDIPYDFKNIIYIDKAGFKYSQWGGEYQFIRNSALDKVIDSTQYYGYSSETTPSAWSEGKCWVIDIEITSDTQLYNEDGSTISYGGTISDIVTTENEYYTFRKDNEDDSLYGIAKDNVVKPGLRNGTQLLNKNIFGTGCYSNKLEHDSFNNTFGDNCYENTLLGGFIEERGEVRYCKKNFFGNRCYRNMLGYASFNNTFGNDCCNNTFSNNCYNNTFDNNCSSNSFDVNCYGNTFSYSCSSNTFGKYCLGNTLSYGCNSNTLSYGCSSNTFGNDCCNNTFSNNCSYNSLSNYCTSNSFGNDSSNNTLFSSYCRYITFGEGAMNVRLTAYEGGNSTKQVQNYRIANGTYTKDVEVFRNNKVEYTVADNSNSELKVFNLGDLADLLNS